MIYSLAPTNGDPSTDRPTTLHGRRLLLARTVWIALVGLVVALYVAGVPTTLQRAGVPTTAFFTGTPVIHDQILFPAVYWATLDTLMLLGFLIISVLVFWRRANDWMAMFVTLMLMLTALLYTTTSTEPRWLLAVLFTLAEISQVACLLIFPTGRWVPRLSWLVLLPMLVWRPLIWYTTYLPNAALQAHFGSNTMSVPQYPLDVALLMVFFTVGIAAQVYRYRLVSLPVERQQTKWLLLSATCAVVVSGGYTILINRLATAEGIQQGVVLWRLVVRTVRQVAMLLLPVSLMYAVLRYRLFDIDTLLRGTLVYGVLTGLLAMIYSIGIVGVGVLVRPFAGANSDLAVVVSTLAIVAVFNPLRRRVQYAIDRRFFRRKYDAQQTIQAFSEQLRDDVALEVLQRDLVHVVQDTLQPTHVHLSLVEPKR